MKPSERAAEISAILSKDQSIAHVQCQKPLVSELPFRSPSQSFALAINLCVKPSEVSLPLLWALTVPVISRLSKAGKLNEFTRVGVQVVAIGDQKDGDRVLRVESLVCEVEKLPAKQPEDLLNEDIWDNVKFACHWYWNKKSVAR